MQDLLVIANLKMTMLRRRDVVNYCDQLRKTITNTRSVHKGVKFVVCPSAPHLDVVHRAEQSEQQIATGAQNVFWERRGSYTGQISPLTLADSGVSYALVGHSEQRQFGHSTDVEIGKKVATLIEAEITPVIFIGETRDERDSGRIKDALSGHMQSITDNVRPQDIARCVFVYEPVWAIGGTVTPTPEEIMSARILMQKILTQAYGPERVRSVRFLYGGSVTPENATMFTKDVGMSGVVLGRAGTHAQSYVQIADTLSHIARAE